MADTRAAKIPSPAHRETALCRVLPFVKKKLPGAMQSGMQPCASCTVWMSAPAAQGSPPSLLAYLPACLPAAPALAHILQVRGPPSVWRRARRIFESLGHEPADI